LLKKLYKVQHKWTNNIWIKLIFVVCSQTFFTRNATFIFTN